MSLTADPTVEQRLRAFGLLPAEYELILARLGREPNLVELGMLGAMWSEHCSYKHSRKLLKQLPTSGPRVVQGPGENAGAVDIGDGLAVVLKMESHNHPSAVEPFQGAATGVGGILRDIFTMGARPVAILDSLRFGAFEDARTQFLLGGVVGGIGHYGNCLAGDERLVWRTKDGVIHFGTIGDFVDTRLEPLHATDDLGDAGAEVLSADPKANGAPCWRPVRRVFKRRAARLVRLKTSLGRHVRLTPEHPVLVHDGAWSFRAAAVLRPGDQVALTLTTPHEPVDPPEVIDLIEILRARPALARGVSVDLPEAWRPTDQVRAALRRIEPMANRRCDYLQRRRLPWHHFCRLEPLLGLAHADLRVHRRSGKANVMKAVIQADEQFARLLGYFASGGCVSSNGTTEVVAFTFGRHEQQYVDDVVAAVIGLGLRPRVICRESTIAVYVTSWLLGSLLRDVWECGSNSVNKAVPGFVFTWPVGLQFEVMKGLFRGDGCLTKSHGNRAKISFASSSRRLFEQTLALVHNRRIVPSCHAERPASRSDIGERSLSWAPSWHLEITRRADLLQLCGLFTEDRDAEPARATELPVNARLARPRSRLHEMLATVAITEIEQEEPVEDGELVYDLEVEDTHCFVSSGGLTVHNCFGTPTVGGEISFDPGYAGNPIVNAMCVGVVEKDRLMRARASGPGNSLLLVGADTGRDGLQGAAFASNDDPEASHRGVVQVGNPFLEKLLLEACLAVLETGDVLAMQDLGAAGLTSSAIEMAARGGLGVDIDVARVPRRETGLGAFEVMLSESQERMLLLVRAGREAAIQAHFARWELHAAVIGQVVEEPSIRVREQDVVVAELPIALLTDDVPAYDLSTEVDAGGPADTSALLGRAAGQGEPRGDEGVAPRGRDDGPRSSEDFGADLLRLLGSPNLRSRHFAYRQYDSTVQGNTALGPGGAAAVVRVEGTTKGLAISTDCNPRFMRLDPRRGAAQAVAEAARNLACVGAEPIAVTDCLNFGNPEKPRVAWQLTEAIAGLSEACRALGVPIVSGNVSLYNEAAGRAIPPTPTVGMVGLLEDVRRVVPTGFVADDQVVLLGEAPTSVGASEFRPHDDGFPRFDLESERRLGALLRELASRGLVRSAQDVADGGLAVALAECALLGECGAILQLEGPSMEATLFSEDQGRAVVTCDAASVEALVALADAHQLRARVVGRTGGDRLRVEPGLDVTLAALRAAWEPAQ